MTAASVSKTAQPNSQAAPDEGSVPPPMTDVTAAAISPLSRDAVTSPAPNASSNRLDLLRNVEMEVTAELGSTRMTVRELLSLTPGNIVELNRAAGSPVDLLVNGTLIARGEVVVVDEEFGIRISEIVNPGGGESS